ncbi:phage holin family protein [Listeria aquatica]|uniref:phage holin family protein n=1 Tax=Listeria aquatica TaxID=1494960 RepID=UPI003EF36E5E
MQRSETVNYLIMLGNEEYLTGLLCAGYYGKLNSKVGFRGIAKKLAIFILVAIAHLADSVLGDRSIIRDAVIFFYFANELISILENVAKMDLSVPDQLKNLVEVFKNKSNEKGKED